MYLKRLEIQGFKSFANKTTLEFEKGITAVVGPNGSGKSNIADSIRWVLGEQSLKQLRGKKSEDVIFAGSERKAKLSFAEVSVTFDNADRKIPIDYSEVSITRRMDRSGESDYLINGNKVRLLDIVDLVLKSNIGTSRYTVIGQGTIDQMILAGPAEVKNLIDEASGVKTYYIRREKALKRLEQTTQNLIRVQDLLTEIEPRLKSLRRQAKRMQERSSIEQELKSYQSELFSSRYWQIEKSLYGLNSQLDVLTDSRRGLEDQIQKLRSSLDKGEQNNRAEVSDYQKIQMQIKKLSEQKNKLVEDVALIRGRLQAEKNIGGGDAKSLNIEKQNLESARNSIHSEIKKAKAQAENLEKDLQKQNALLRDSGEKLKEIQDVLDHPEKINLGDLSRNIEDLERDFQDFFSGIERASELSEILPLASNFQNSFGKFKQKTSQFIQNPFENFEKQRKALQQILFEKDRLGSELNRLDLEKSRAIINLDYQEKELAKIEQRLLQVNLEIQSTQAVSIDDYFKKLIEQEQKLNQEIIGVAEQISALEQNISKYHASEQSRKQQILEEERLYRQHQDQLSKLKDQESGLAIEKARFETQKENVLSEASQAIGSEAVAEFRKSSGRRAIETAGLEEKIIKLKNQLDMIGGIDELTLKEYQETEQRYSYLTGQTKDLQKAMADLRSVIEELDVYIKRQFNEAFSRIDEQFQNYFRVLFNGGRAYLSLLRPVKEQQAEAETNSDSENIENSADPKLRPEEKILAKYEKGADEVIGIDIKATPPGKKLSSISALSGGERALTSIALLCALLTCFPSPFVVLDEVDAALDEANTIRFAQILASLADRTQFITVTHNRETMRQAHTLYGITMGDDSISKILSLKIEQAQAYAK